MASPFALDGLEFGVRRNFGIRWLSRLSLGGRIKPHVFPQILFVFLDLFQPPSVALGKPAASKSADADGAHLQISGFAVFFELI